jgi:N-acetylated-alpha-linked acidic dipeptidase
MVRSFWRRNEREYTTLKEDLMRHYRITFLLIFLAVSAGTAFAESQQVSLLGFSAARTADQLALEREFDEQLNADNLRNWMERLTARPHHLGSASGKTIAHWLSARFQEWGFETKIELFHVLFPTPRVRVVELIEPTPFRARLIEPAIEEDSTSSQRHELLPAYNAYSIDGNVTAPLVYVNYGIPADYAELERRGIDVTGKIVIARYGGSWRGIKPKLAAENGAVGCILYSDPHEDGYFQGDVYPGGAFRNEDGAQRGSVLDMPLYPGDPLTPGLGATKKADRLAIEDAATLTKIPVLPISYGDALPLLSALEGPVAPPAWRGALPLTYHIGPGPALVHLELEHDWNMVPLYDVIAMLKGSELPDEWIIRGNHHDAWTHGANDPVSGLVALLEEARAVGALAKAGHLPKRTIVFAAWDGEEPGLLGSTEWVETHRSVLEEKCVAYINSDSNGRGFIGAGGSHTLELFFGQVARDVNDPQVGGSIAERLRSRTLVSGSPEAQALAREVATPPLYALGSGSDYTPFFQHLGIASLNIGFGGENHAGVYHSLYDSFDHYSRFGDPGFQYGIALAQTSGRIVLRLANADRLPFEFTHFGRTVSGYVSEVALLTEEMRDATERQNLLLEEGRFKAAADPQRPYFPPKPEEAVPHLNFSPLQNSLTSLQASAQRYSERLQLAHTGSVALTEEQDRELNRLLFQAERILTREEGLPGRPWFTHHIYAPGFYTGYGVKTLPGVREAIEARDWKEAERQIQIVSEILRLYTAQIDRASAILDPGE